MFWLMNVTACSPPPRPALKTGLEGKMLPSFNLLLADSVTTFNTANLPKNKPIVLFFFSPTCPYCRAQTEEIVKNIQSLKGVEFCILTFAPYSEFKSFYTEYKLDKYKNIIAGVDYANFFPDYFKAQSVPYTVFYNNKKQLKQVMLGKLDEKEIKALALN